MLIILGPDLIEDVAMFLSGRAFREHGIRVNLFRHGDCLASISNRICPINHVHTCIIGVLSAIYDVIMLCSKHISDRQLTFEVSDWLYVHFVVQSVVELFTDFQPELTASMHSEG